MNEEEIKKLTDWKARCLEAWEKLNVESKRRRILQEGIEISGYILTGNEERHAIKKMNSDTERLQAIREILGVAYVEGLKEEMND